MHFNILLSNIYPDNMYYFHSINNLKLKSFMNSIQRSFENTKDLEDKNLEIIDAELISNLRSICVKFFFLNDTITQMGDSSVEDRKEMLTDKVRPQLQSLLEDEDSKNIESIIPPLITKLVDNNFDRVYIKDNDKKFILKKLNVIKQNLSNDKMKFFVNTYYNAHMKIQEILEIIYMFVTKDENIDTYQSNSLLFNTSQQRRQVQMNAKKAFKRINKGGEFSEKMINDVANYFMVKFNEK